MKKLVPWTHKHIFICARINHFSNFFVHIEKSRPHSRLVFVSFLSAEGRAKRPAEVPRVHAVMFSWAASRLCSAPRASRARCWLSLAPSATRSSPTWKTRTRSRGAQQNQERQKEQNRVYRAPANGSGEEIRKTEIPLDPGQVRQDSQTKPLVYYFINLQLWNGFEVFRD